MPKYRQISGVGMGMGFAPTWLRQVSPRASQNHFNHWQWVSLEIPCATLRARELGMLLLLICSSEQTARGTDSA